MRRRRWPWLLAAAVLVGLGALLMRVGEGERPPPPPWERVEIPRRATADDRERMRERQVLAQLPAPPMDDAGYQAPERPRDPVLAALGAEFYKQAYVIEANAIVNSPVGSLLIDCITSEDEGAGLNRFREISGLDPLKHLDRIAVSDDLAVFGGDFRSHKPESFRADTTTQFGEQGTVYERHSTDGGASRYFGTWGDQLIVAANDAEAIKQTFERIEGKRPIEGGLGDHHAYGEIYGVFSAQVLADAFGEDNPELAERVAKVAEGVELHVDTSSDIGVAARVSATNAADAKDVSKALGAALSLARLRAQAEGKSEVADLLDMGRVISDPNGFRLEAGVPLPWLEATLKRCVEKNRARLAEKARARADAGAN